MAEIKDIPTASIDAKSRVNVRRSEVENGVERVKASIAEHGFWRNNPITIRPHPDTSSGFMYEVIIGQCRLKACLDLGIKQIPAVIQELDDNEAIRRSWAENEGRSDITPGDKAYWVRTIVRKAWKEVENETEALETAAKFFAMSVQSVKKYYPVGALPAEVREMVGDGKPLRMADAEAIAKSVEDLVLLAETKERSMERARWIADLPDKVHKDEAVKALKKMPARVSVEKLDKMVREAIDAQTARVEIAIVIPKALQGKLLQWGEQEGLKHASEADIISHMINKTLRSM
jgi:ParB/RepB/Spo0J family partition protein